MVRLPSRLPVDNESDRVAIRDSGIGISEDDQRQLFTRFFRAKNSATAAVGGTGLGPTIMRSLVEMQGGTISVASAPGQGSTFSFTLPAVRSESLVGTMESSKAPE